MIHNSVGYDCIDMENLLADNEDEIIHMCSMISNHNYEGHSLNIFSAVIDHSVKQFNCKYMSLYLDFKYL